MELDRHERLGLVSDAFIGIVIDVLEPGLPVFRQSLVIDCKSMILRCDVTSFCADLNTGLILASMAVFKFVSICSGGQGHDLIAETNAECGNIFFQAALDKGYTYNQKTR